MRTLPTVEKAKNEINQLQEFVFLAENYEEDTLTKQIIKRYAFTSSVAKVVSQLNEERAAERLLPIEPAYVKEVIQSKPTDRLHQLVRTQYRQRTRHLRY